MDGTLFNVTFENDAHARLFAASFTKYAPSIRRALVNERADFLLHDNPEELTSDELLTS